MSRAVVFGGAGFIGRGISSELLQEGWNVVVADGLMDRTTCDPVRTKIIPGLRFVQCITDEQPDLVANLVENAHLVVDAMGWTRHLEAITDPLWDLRLNVASHLPLIHACTHVSGKSPIVIFLGSSHQYGKSTGALINEDSKMIPLDVQGVHKLAAEGHWRIASEHGPGLSVISLRFGNTFGPGMPSGYGDIGLIGGFFRSAFAGESIRVFGSGRRRNIVFSPDISRLVCKLARVEFAPGFHPFNVNGHDVEVEELAKGIVAATGTGSVLLEPMPQHIKKIEIKDAPLSDTKLHSALGDVPLTDLAQALRITASEWLEESGDQALT